MGFFGNLRAAGTTSLAAAFIDKHLRLQKDVGRFNGDPRKMGETIVLSLWGAIPALAAGEAKPKPVLLAAAAVAKAIKDADLAGEKNLGNVLHSALKTLWMVDLRKLVDIERIAGIDRELFDLAASAFESA